MRLLPDNGKLAEVLVEGQNNLAAAVSMRQDNSVPRIGWPIDDTLNIVSGVSERRGNRAGHATVDQDLHALGP